MDRRATAVSALLVFALAVGAQVAFTDVGRQIGGAWTEPAEAARLDADGAAGFAAIDAAGDGETASLAWVETTGTESRVYVARLHAAGDPVRDVRQLATVDATVSGVAVAHRGDRRAVAWVDADRERVRLWTSESGTRTVSVNTTRVESPGVALLADRVAVTWRGYQDGYVGRLALVGDTVTRRSFGTRVTGANAPSVTAADGELTLAWVNGSNAGLYVATGRPTGEFDARRVADARGTSSFGGGGQQAAVDLAGTAPVLAWSDLGTVAVSSSPGQRRILGDGQVPRVGAADGDWLATYLVSRRASGTDVAYAASLDGRTRSGFLSRLPSNAVRASPAMADAPVVAWVERGQARRLLVAAYDGGGPAGPVARLRAAPRTFGFVAVAAVGFAVVTLPLLPWVVAPLLVGFLLTTRTVLDAGGAVLAGVLGVVGRDASRETLRRGLRRVPGWAGLVAFLPVNVALFVYLTRGGVLPGATIVAPLWQCALALGGGVAVARVHGVTSPWRLVGVYAYCQAVVMWAATLPQFL